MKSAIWRLVASSGALSLLVACQGSIDGAGSSRATPTPAGSAGSGGVTNLPGGGSAATCQALPTRRIRRLARREYANVVTDLLGASAGDAVLAALPAEPKVRGFDNQDAFLFVSAPFQEATAELAAALAAKADVSALAPCANGDTEPCITAFIRAFGSRAYGRELTEDEVARARSVAALGESYAVSIRLVIELTLQSPNLLYVTELGAPSAPAAPAAAIALTADELRRSCRSCSPGVAPTTRCETPPNGVSSLLPGGCARRPSACSRIHAEWQR